MGRNGVEERKAEEKDSRINRNRADNQKAGYRTTAKVR